MAPRSLVVPALVCALLVYGPPAHADVDDGDSGGDAAEEDDGSGDAPGGGDSIRTWRGGGPLSLGFTIGTINGLSLKLWPARVFGLTVDVGTTTVLNTLAAGVAGRFHLPAIQVPDSPVSIHMNLGPRFRTRMAFGTSVYAELGGGAVFGGVIVVRDVPIEIFFDVAPNVAGSVTHPGAGRGFDIDGTVGLRYAF